MRSSKKYVQPSVPSVPVVPGVTDVPEVPSVAAVVPMVVSSLSSAGMASAWKKIKTETNTLRAFIIEIDFRVIKTSMNQIHLFLCPNACHMLQIIP